MSSGERDGNSAIDDTGFFGHPKGLSVLFFSELWERFSFYGMRALLVLYMVKAVGYDRERAVLIFGAYGALVYAFPVIGGWFANRWLGYRNAITLGAVFMALGHFAMAFQFENYPAITEFFFFTAMALLCIGNGFFKPNVSSTVGRLYKDNDPRRDRGFTIFYMSINIGALMAPWVCGLLGEKISWHYGFGAAGVGMLLGLVVFQKGQRHIGKHGDPDDPELLARPVVGPLNRLHLTWIGCFAAAALCAKALYEPELATFAIGLVSIAVLVVLLTYVNMWLGATLAALSTLNGLMPTLFRSEPLFTFEVAGLNIGGALVAIFAVAAWLVITNKTEPLEKQARYRLGALIILMFFHMMFFAGFEQAGSSFTLLADQHVDRHVLGSSWELPASVLQSVNPGFIVLLTPLFVVMWRFLSQIRKNPSIPMKFAFGLAQLGLGFWVLTVGISRADGATVALGWLIFCYFLHTTGEMWLSPIGLSAVTKLAPKKWVGFCMGAWFLTIANAHLVAAGIAKLTGGEGDYNTMTDAQKLDAFSSVYMDVFWTMLAAAGVLVVLTPFIKRLIRGVDDEEDLSGLPKAEAKENA